MLLLLYEDYHYLMNLEVFYLTFEYFIFFIIFYLTSSLLV